MSEARNADVQMSAGTVMSGTPQRGGGVVERGLLIGGKSVPASSGGLADDVSPWDGEIYARVAAGTPADITRAADAAEAAFPAWSAAGAFERREIFLRAADVMASRSEEAITALARETGASRLFAEFNLAFCIQVLREAAAAITRPMERRHRRARRNSPGHSSRRSAGPAREHRSWPQTWQSPF